MSCRESAEWLPAEASLRTCGRRKFVGESCHVQEEEEVWDQVGLDDKAQDTLLLNAEVPKDAKGLVDDRGRSLLLAGVVEELEGLSIGEEEHV